MPAVLALAIVAGLGCGNGPPEGMPDAPAPVPDGPLLLQANYLEDALIDLYRIVTAKEWQAVLADVRGLTLGNLRGLVVDTYERRFSSGDLRNRLDALKPDLLTAVDTRNEFIHASWSFDYQGESMLRTRIPRRGAVGSELQHLKVADVEAAIEVIGSVAEKVWDLYDEVEVATRAISRRSFAMRVSVFCSECSDMSDPEKVVRWDAPVTGHGINVSNCPAGHKVRFWVQTPFFFLLFLRGLTDLARRDTRGGVLNAYSAWDTFVARMCALLLDDLGASGAWGGLDSRLRRAESLLALFCGLVVAKTKALPKLVKKAQETRNRVIHGDYIPTEDEAFAVATEVLDTIRAFHVALPDLLAKDEFGDAMKERMNQAGREQLKVKPQGWTQVGTIGITVRLDLDVRAEVEAIRGESFPELVG